MFLFLKQASGLITLCTLLHPVNFFLVINHFSLNYKITLLTIFSITYFHSNMLLLLYLLYLFCITETAKWKRLWPPMNP